MTTIAWDGKILAVDSQTTDGDCKAYENKLWKYNGGWFTVTGKWIDYPGYLRILNKEDSKITKKSLCVFTKGSALYEQFGNSYPMKISGKSAWGSGAVAARVAMSLGKTAIEAIKVASKFDINTGGRVRSVTVKKNKS